MLKEESLQGVEYLSSIKCRTLDVNQYHFYLGLIKPICQAFALNSDLQAPAHTCGMLRLPFVLENRGSKAIGLKR